MPRPKIRLSGVADKPLWVQLVLGLAVATACTLICLPLSTIFPLAELVMVYILGVMLASLQFNRMASALTAVMCAAAFDFFFVLPRFNLVPSDLKHLVTVAGLLAMGLVISSLTARLLHQITAVAVEQERTRALLALSRELARTESIADLAAEATEHVGSFFSAPVAVFLAKDANPLYALAAAGLGRGETAEAQLSAVEQDPSWRELAARAFATGPDEDVTVSGIPESAAAPLTGSRGNVGALVIRPNVGRTLSSEEASQLKAFAAQTGLAIERAQLEVEAEQARLAVETERLRGALLSSVSHDLRTPLGAITGATSALLDDQKLLYSASGRDLLTTVYEEAVRLNRLVGSLLDMTRLEAGAVAANKEWQPLEEVIGAALTRRADELAGHQVTVKMDYTLPLVEIDSVLIEQALGNILDNAARHTPRGTEIELEARPLEDGVEIRVADRGPGLVAGEESLVFDKFYRGPAGRTGGAGLGLAVVRGIIEVHGGRVWAERREGGGSVFHIFLPMVASPPHLALSAAREDDPVEEE